LLRSSPAYASPLHIQPGGKPVAIHTGTPARFTTCSIASGPVWSKTV
jgi:hypothetical protein